MIQIPEPLDSHRPGDVKYLHDALLCRKNEA
jgi:hypothetical protein